MITNNQIESLCSGQEVYFIFGVNIPLDVESGIYNLNVSIVCSEASDSTTLIINVISGDFEIFILNTWINIKQRGSNLKCWERI